MTGTWESALVDWSAIVRSFIVLVCIFNPLSLIAISSEGAPAQNRAKRSTIVSSALCAALFLVSILNFLSVVFSVLSLAEASLRLAGGAILLASAVHDFQGSSSIYPSNERGTSECPVSGCLHSVTTIPSIASVFFLISDTNGSPDKLSYVMLAAVSAGYFMFLGRICRKGGSAVRPEIIAFRRVPSGIVLIVAIDMILLSIWPYG